MQFIRFSSSSVTLQNLFSLGDYYPPDSERADIIKQSESLLTGLIAITQGKEHPSVIAAQWAKFELNTLLWFLYLVFAQLQYMQFIDSKLPGIAAEQLQQLSSTLNPPLIFAQLDKISGILKKLGHNININQSLVLEDFLFALIAI